MEGTPSPPPTISSLLLSPQSNAEQGREVAEAFWLAQHPPSPFEAEETDKLRGSSEAIRPDVEASAQAYRHANGRKRLHIFRDPALLQGKAEANEEQIGATGIDPLAHTHVLGTRFFKIPVVTPTNVDARIARPKPLCRRLGNPCRTAEQKDPRPLRTLHQSLCKIDPRNAARKRMPAPSCRHQNPLPVRQRKIRAVEQISDRAISPASIQHHRIRRKHHTTHAPHRACHRLLRRYLVDPYSV